MTTIIKPLTLSLLAMFAATVYAKDDTDIYFPDESVSTSQNVLFVMDVSGSMSAEVGNTGQSRFQAMKAAFNEILNTVPPSINVGIMNFGSIGASRSSFGQGVKFPVSPLTADARAIVEAGLPLNADGTPNWNANNIPEPAVGSTVFDFLPKIADSWSPTGWTPLVDSLYEAALYYRGEKVDWGLGPLEENGNEWVAHPSTYTGSPGAWDNTVCDTVWTERLPDGVVPAEYRCPADASNPVSPGTYANCDVIKTDCVPASTGGGSTSYTSSPTRDYSQTYTLSGYWNSSGGQSISASGNDIYLLDINAAGNATINLWDANGTDDDTYLYLLDENNTILAEDDDGAGYYYDSRLTYNFPAAGTYKIVAATYSAGEVGDYGLSVEGTNIEKITYPSGIEVRKIGGAWTNSGGRDETSSDNPVYYFTVDQSGDFTIDLTSSTVDTYLYLLTEDGTIIDQNDDGGSGYNSRITQTLSAGVYQVIAATYSTGESGDFEVQLQGIAGEFPYTGSTGSSYPEARYVKFVALSAYDSDPWTSVAELSLIDDADLILDKGLWSLVSVDSEETDAVSRPATNAFDNDTSTFWHTQWYYADPVHPHQLIIDLGALHNLKEFRYLARQDGEDNGRVNAYEVYLSTDGSTWDLVLSSNFDDNATEQAVLFPTGSGSGSGTGNQIAICHIPDDNPDNAQTLIIDVADLDSHRAHGDLEGACGSGLADVGSAEGTCLYTMCSGAAASEPTYITPVKSACQSNAIILLSDGYPQAGSSVAINATYDKVVTNNEGTNALADIFRGLNCEASPAGLTRGRCGPELMAYLANNDNLSGFEGDQTIQTYTVGLGLGQNSAAENYLKMLTTVDDPDTAAVEGYFSASDQATLITAFSDILSELELNTTTTAFSNPGYSVVTKTGLNHEDSVFIPTFEVGTNVLWKGNLKKFKTVNSNGLRLIQGKNNQNAVTELGAFTVGALDYWSTSETADGTDVAKGGAASLLDPAVRNLYTDIGCAASVDCDLTEAAHALSITNVSVDNSAGLTDSFLGLTSATEAERKKYICFIRGYEDFDANEGACRGNARKHMGDMLHFEPMIVTYDKDHNDKDSSTHKQVIFAGTNEGYLHAFDTYTGEEIFAFMPQALLKNIKPQFDDNVYRGHKYGVDGYANVWINDIDHDGVIESAQGEHVYLYFGLRRGGNIYYALDITDPNTPKVKWKIEGGNDGYYQHLGETWSKPYLARMHTVKNDASLKEVLIFTGGYDSNNQDKPVEEREASDTVGNDVFVVDAKTGEFIWSIKKGTVGGNAIAGSSELTHSIPGGVRILDMNKDGAVDRMYFADVVGNVWRLELDGDLYDDDSDNFDLNDSKLIKIASLNMAQTGVEPRKFFNEPDVSLTRKGGQTSLLIAIGSGDRTSPLDTETTDRFYVLADRRVRLPLPEDYTAITEEDLVAVEMTTDAEGAITLTNPLVNQSVLTVNDKRGWYFQFSGEGEKVLSNSLTNRGKVIFTTLVPDIYANVTSSISACNIPATQGRAYVLDILQAKPVVDLDGDGGDPDNDDLFTVVSANEIPGGVQLVFNEPRSSSGKACSEGDCVQDVDLRSGKKLSQIMTYNAGVLESVFWSKPQEKRQ